MDTLKKIRILYTSDIHAFVMPKSYNMDENFAQSYGMARVSSFFKQARNESSMRGEHVIALDGGDFLQGSALSWYLARVVDDPIPLSETFNTLQYDAVVIGNHEFNYGQDYLGRALAAMNMPKLAANIVYVGNEQEEGDSNGECNDDKPDANNGDTDAVGSYDGDTGGLDNDNGGLDNDNGDFYNDDGDTAGEPINIKVSPNKGEPAFGKPYHIFDLDGLKVGVLGLSTMFTPNWERQDHLEGLEFISAMEAAQKYAPHVREESDIFFIIYHGSFERDPQSGRKLDFPEGENEGYALARRVWGLDFILTAHQHRTLQGRIKGVPYVQLTDKAAQAADIHIEYDEKKKRITSFSCKILSMDDFEPDPAIVGPYQEISQKLGSILDNVVGHTEEDWRIHDVFAARLKGHPYVDWLNNMQCEISGAAISGTALFDRGTIGFNGDIRIGDILQAYPYPNTLAVLEVTGADLREALERCAAFFVLDESGNPQINPSWLEPKYKLYNYDLYYGIEYTFDLRKDFGERLVRLNYANGEEIKPDDCLEVVLNNYRAVGGGDFPMFEHKKIIREIPLELSDHMIQKIIREKTIEPVPPNQMKILY